MEIKHQENPAKIYLRRYRALVLRRESLERAIADAYDSATNITQRMDTMRVQTSPSDKMGDVVARISDTADQLREVEKRASEVLAEILKAIDAVEDEMQKTVLTMRYVEGLDWITISERIHYEDRYTFIIHGRALAQVRRWLESVQESAVVKGL